jgi:hypothetical protein
LTKQESRPHNQASPVRESHMSNLIRTFFSALRQWDATEQRAPKSGKESDSRYVTSPLPRHRISLTATASFGFSAIPEEIRIRDINEKGLYFCTNFDMPIGSSLDIVVVLPPDISADGKGRRVHYEAKVVRVERERGKEQYGVGAAIRRCETFPLPTTTSPKRPAATAPNRAPAPAPKSVQPTKTVQEKLQPVPKAHAPLRVPKTAEPVPIPKTTARVEEPIAPVEETIAPAVPTIPDRNATIQNRRAVVEKLATAGLRAGISLEELIELVNSGIRPTELVDIIEARLTAQVARTE